jgi:hypothetical protein
MYTKTLPVKFTVKTPNEKVSELAQKQLFALGYTWGAYGNNTNIKHLDRTEINIGYYGGHDMTVGREHYQLVSLEELFVSQAPPKTFKDIGVLPWRVVVRNDTVDVGCQKQIPKADFEKLIAEIKDFRENENVEKTVLDEPWYMEYPNDELFAIIQKKLFSLGWEWNLSGKTVIEVDSHGFIFSCAPNGFSGYDGGNVGRFKHKCHEKRKITVEELFAVGAGKAEKKILTVGTIGFNLTSEGIKVDGRTITWKKFDEFIKQYES